MGTSGDGLGAVEGWRPSELLCRPPPIPIPISQLKVPVEEPANELPMNEIEAWKAAEKVGALHYP